jgi:hypothetical protein
MDRFRQRETGMSDEKVTQRNCYNIAEQLFNDMEVRAGLAGRLGHRQIIENMSIYLHHLLKNHGVRMGEANKPCPFCGSPARMVEGTSETNPHVRCSSIHCNTSGPPRCDDHNAWAAWNKRTAEVNHET